MGIICILIAIIIVLIAIIIGYKREFRKIREEINNNLNQYVNVKTKSVDRDLEALVEEINLIFDSKQKVVAEKNKTEEELRASIANMSHDLRTPLTSIMGYLQMIRVDNISDNDKNEYMDIIEKRTKSLQQLISSFYDLSRIEGNEYNFYYKKINLSNILCENIALFYMIKHGENFVKIGLNQKDDVIITEFINKATDLTQENVDKLFERFYTVDKSRSDRNTGLGLYITKVLVEKLGYNINANLRDNNLIVSIAWKIN